MISNDIKLINFLLAVLTVLRCQLVRFITIFVKCKQFKSALDSPSPTKVETLYLFNDNESSDEQIMR